MAIPRGLCQCGCGMKTDTATRDRKGYSKGEPLLYRRGHIGKVNSRKVYDSKLIKDKEGRDRKLCTACGKHKLLDEFNKSATRLERLRSYCKKCERDQANAYYRKNPQPYRDKAKKFNKKRRQERMKEMNDIKRSKGCLFCPENDPCALDFHHIKSRSKHGGIPMSKAAGFSDKRFKEELAKCEVICAGCHRKLHAGRLSIKDRIKEVT